MTVRWGLAAQTAARAAAMLTFVRSRQDVCNATRPRSPAEREPKPRQVERMLADVANRGTALVMLRGPAAGRSPLPSRAARTASKRGMRVLTTAGVAGEAALPYAGLHRLLGPVLSRLDELPESCSGALEVAFGRATGPQPHVFRLAFAVLDLLAAAAADEPVAVIVDDMHRLDRASADVLCIVARWLAPHHRVFLLLAGRAAQSRTLAGGDLEQLKLGSFGRRAPRPSVRAPRLSLAEEPARGFA
jgi:hypothetical protein